MKYEKVENGNCTVVRFDEHRFDAANAQELKTELLRIVDGGNRKLGLDMTGVQFVDSSGLGMLVAVLKKVGGNGKLCLWGLSPEVKTLLELTQLYKVFEVFDLEADALAHFN